MVNKPINFIYERMLFMFEKIKENVKLVKEVAIEYGKELKDDTVKYCEDHGEVVCMVLQGTLVIGLMGIGLGVNLANRSNLDVYKNGVEYIGDGTKFNKVLNYHEWMEYLDMLYHSKDGKRNKRRKAWLRSKGYID